VRRLLAATITSTPCPARRQLAFTMAIGRHFLVADHPGYSTHDVLALASDYLLRPEQ